MRKKALKMLGGGSHAPFSQAQSSLQIKAINSVQIKGWDYMYIPNTRARALRTYYSMMTFKRYALFVLLAFFIIRQYSDVLTIKWSLNFLGLLSWEIRDSSSTGCSRKVLEKACLLFPNLLLHPCLVIACMISAKFSTRYSRSVDFKGLRIVKMFLAPTQAPFRSNLQINTGPVGAAMALTTGTIVLSLRKILQLYRDIWP